MANDTTDETVVEELSLLLISCTRFRERNEERERAWKGEDVGVLDNVQKNASSACACKARSVSRAEQGSVQAREFM